jgi:hypothetical protein
MPDSTFVPETLRQRAREAETEWHVTFTDHALQRMWQRRIDPFDAAETARRPDRGGQGDLGPAHLRVTKTFCTIRGSRLEGTKIIYAVIGTSSGGTLVIETVGWREPGHRSV